MAWTTGTATNYLTLMDAIRTFLLDLGWEELKYTQNVQFSVRGPGNGTFGQPIIHFHPVTVGDQKWGLAMYGSTGFSYGAARGAQPGTSPAVYASLWDQTIKYWFFANRRRFIMVCKMATVYSATYLGFFLPWARPDQYSLPMYIGSDGYGLFCWYDNYPGRRSFHDPGGYQANLGGAYFLKQNGSIWVIVANHDDSSSGTASKLFDVSSYGVEHAVIWPYHVLEVSVLEGWTGGNTGTASLNDGYISRFVPTRQQEFPAFPLTLLNSFSGTYANNLGILDGCVAVLGRGLSTEREVTLEGRNYIVFQNTHRTDPHNFVGILKA